MSFRSGAPGAALPTDLTRDIERAGYYPALVRDVVSTALARDRVASHLVHQETTFDHDTVRRHVTVLVLTDTRLLVVHADDDVEGGGPGAATATSESVPLAGVRGVMLTHVVADPASYTPGRLGHELTVTIGWGSVSRVDLLPATCGDPQCDADHGYEGSITADDISVRVSAVADGDAALTQAIAFAGALQAATAR
ncbi:DUF5998 family protein [Piscicoccus intestinalis]|uniref:DUF5998 family protein n=1 Tax=Piscicoccus intestinalis TaxID=746033 RepID=UPI0008381059|nr:DUF5998 family protein [Piscicoccus intestinalis]